MTSRIELALTDGSLPWLPGPHQLTTGLASQLMPRLPRELRSWLPPKIELVVGPDVSAEHLQQFLSGMVSQFLREFPVWATRLKQVTRGKPELGESLAASFSCLRGCQPWLILVTTHGGFDLTRAHVDGAIVTCSSKQHHGVAWWSDDQNQRRTALITARSPGADWNWDEDIGHEVAHASFAPVPLFTQNIELQSRAAHLPDGIDFNINELSAIQLSRLFYAGSEVLTVAMRGEQRFTATGLPEFKSSTEFRSYLALLHQLAPTLGFDRAAHALAGTEWFHVGFDSKILELVPPLLAFFARTRHIVDAQEPPSVASIAGIFQSHVETSERRLAS